MNRTGRPRNGAELLLDGLIRHGVRVAFAYPGGATLPIHQALTRVADRLRTILPRHEQGGGFAASAYARSTGNLGVCFATSGPGATNLVTCLADAQRHAVPLLAITGQVNRAHLGKDAFQEIPIVSVCRAITKHHYLVNQAEDIPRIVNEAVHIATTGRPGPVIIDVPKDQQARIPTMFDDDPPVRLPGHDFQESGVRGQESGIWSLAGSRNRSVSCRHPVLDAISHRLRAMLPRIHVTTGPGPQLSWVASSFPFLSPGQWIASDSQGAIGFALPAAIGIQAGHPDRTVIAVETPAGFLSSIHELGCAYCEKLPVKVLLVHSEDGDGDDPSIDLCMLAAGFRAGHRRLTHAADLDAGLQAMLDHPGPFVLDICIPSRDLARGDRHETRYHHHGGSIAARGPGRLFRPSPG